MHRCLRNVGSDIIAASFSSLREILDLPQTKGPVGIDKDAVGLLSVVRVWVFTDSGG